MPTLPSRHHIIPRLATLMRLQAPTISHNKRLLLITLPLHQRSQLIHNNINRRTRRDRHRRDMSQPGPPHSGHLVHHLLRQEAEEVISPIYLGRQPRGAEVAR